MGKKPVLSAEREAEFIALFPHHSDATLAERFGITVRQAHHIGAKNGLHKTAATRSASRRSRVDGPALTKQIETIIAGRAEAGTSRTGLELLLPQISPSSVTSALNALTTERRIFRAGRKGNSHWFSTEAHAAAFAASTQALRLAIVKPQKPQAPAKPVAAGKGPAYLPGPLVKTAHTRETSCPGVPGPEVRWHANAQRHFAGRIGQYDDDAAGRWASAATTRAA